MLFYGDGVRHIAVSIVRYRCAIFYNQGGTRITLTSSSPSVPIGQMVMFGATALMYSPPFQLARVRSRLAQIEQP
jgi:hypothetical protein